MTAPTRQRRCAAVVLWSLAFLAGGHLGFSLFIHLAWPHLRDPEYDRHGNGLLQRVRETPDRPLVLVLGSSRVSCGLAADELPAGPLVFNMGLTGAGPVNELISLRRVLEQGIRPRAVLIEVLPLFLGPGPGDTLNLEVVPAYRRGKRDRDILPPGKGDGEDTPGLMDYLTPVWFASRFGLLRHWAPRWLPGEKRWEAFETTGQGWLPIGFDRVTPQQYASGLDRAYREHGVNLNFTTVNRQADRIYQLMFSLCRQNGIEVLGLLAMPESSEFRRWYRSETRELIDRYLTQLCQEQGTRYINAREWLPDTNFADGHHQLAAGARAFTARLWQEVLQPWAQKECRR